MSSTPASFEAKYQIGVDQFLDLKSIKGDSSDNIPGVPGIGEKGATELLMVYKTLDGVYDNLALVKDSLRKKLEAGKDLAYMSKELARIWTDAPIRLNLDEVDGSKCRPEEILEILKKLEFRSLARQLPEIMHVAETPGVAKKQHGVGGLNVGKNHLIDNHEGLKALSLDSSKQLFVHSRASGKHGRDPHALVLSTDGVETYTLDMTKVEASKIPKDTFASSQVIGYDVKGTLKVLIELGFELPAVAHDVFVGSFLINSLKREQTLTELAQVDLGYDGSPFEDLDSEEFITRAPEIIAAIKALYEIQAKDLGEIPQMARLAKQIEWPVIPVLAYMEHTGIELDAGYLNRFSEEIDDLISDYEQLIYGYADEEFNTASPSQLAVILFDKLDLPKQGIKKGKTGYSTAASELDKLRGSHPIIDVITQYREVAKLKNTYVDTLPLQVDEKSRIHTTFNLTIAQTGRLSSTDPNLQNIPTRTDLGRRIRTAFVAAKGNKLVSADYSQFELRLAAVLAEDEELIDMFNRGADIHTTTAAMIYERSPEDVTKQQRRAAKVINFGILYGMSPHGLNRATGMSFEQATTFIDKYKAVRRPLFDYMDRVKEQARVDGYVATMFGRRRPMPDIHSSNFMVRQGAERAAINVPIQGTEADLVKLAMIKVDEALKGKYAGCKQLLQIHDSILLECSEADAPAVAELVKTTMQDVYTLPVRLDVDVSIGDNWGEL